MLQGSPSASSSAGIKRKYNHQRSRKVCEHCHSRKIRCNVLDSGIPCANCESYGKQCVIRRRKNQRQDATPSDDEESSATRLVSATPIQSVSTKPHPERIESGSTTYASGSNSDETHSRGMQPVDWWNQNAADGMNFAFDPASAITDFSHLTDLDDIFTFTGNNRPVQVQNGVPSSGNTILWSLNSADIRPDDSAYLQSQGCFDVPQDAVLYEMMLIYFRWVHPNLPIVVEDQFWARWNGERFQLGDHSLLLIRAMMFACMAQVDSTMVSRLGYTSKREARTAYYRQAKMLFDMGAEKDPIASAQACLLLTYNSPAYTRLRVNTSWLTQAVRFARIARADSYRRFEQTDPDKAKLLKRIWWGVLFRDRILSLGTRRSLQVHLEPDSPWNSRDEILCADDFFSELGNSPVHHTETQLRVIQLLGAMCRAMPCIAKSTKILYTLEGIDDRVETITETKLPAIVQTVQRALEALQMWHDETIPLFPFPVSLDGEDTPEALCLYVNMLFIYHAAAVFALNVYLVLIYESFPASRSLFDIEDCREALEHANSDVSRRTQELLQVRVIKYLPISATPLIAPPLILQAINVSAARSQASPMEAVEVRKLDIFTRTLKSQQERFEGADYCVDVLNNIIAYAGDDEEFLGSMESWQQRRGSMEGGGRGNGNGKGKVDWGNLVYKRPRLFLRLMLHLDHALCTGGPPVEMDFPVGLRREEST